MAAFTRERITHPKEAFFLPIRSDYVAMFDGDHCAAALIAFFEYAYNRELDRMKDAQENGEPYITASMSRIYENTLGLYSIRRMRERLDQFERIGLIRVFNRGGGRVTKYLLNASVLQDAITHHKRFTAGQMSASASNAHCQSDDIPGDEPWDGPSDKCPPAGHVLNLKEEEREERERSSPTDTTTGVESLEYYTDENQKAFSSSGSEVQSTTDVQGATDVLLSTPSPYNPPPPSADSWSLDDGAHCDSGDFIKVWNGSRGVGKNLKESIATTQMLNENWPDRRFTADELRGAIAVYVKTDDFKYSNNKPRTFLRHFDKYADAEASSPATLPSGVQRGVDSLTPTPRAPWASKREVRDFIGEWNAIMRSGPICAPTITHRKHDWMSATSNPEFCEHFEELARKVEAFYANPTDTFWIDKLNFPWLIGTAAGKMEPNWKLYLRGQAGPKPSKGASSSGKGGDYMAGAAERIMAKIKNGELK